MASLVPEGQKGGALGLITAFGLIIAVVVQSAAGAWSDRWGCKGLVIVSGVLGAAGALLLITATTSMQVLIYVGIIGISIGIFLSVNWAWATDLIPAEGGGLYLGISNLATVGAGVLAAAGGFLLDHFNAQSQNLGYTTLFITTAACYLVGTILAGMVSDNQRKV